MQGKIYKIVKILGRMNSRTVMIERFQDAEFSWHCCPQKTVTIPRSVCVLYLLFTQPSLIRSFHSSDPCFSVSCPKGVRYARVYCIGWSWHPEHDEALRKIKEALTTNPVLSFYDVGKPVKIQADASSTGLGACLLQEGKPVAYASRTLTTAEKSYAQIEKEMLAITYSCRKFHPYIYGKPVQVETDHKPLEIIMKKPLSVTHPRLQRMLLQVQRYQLHVEYVPGKDVLMADALSRAQLPTYEDSDDNLTDDTEVMIYSFINSIPCSAIRWKQLQTMTAQHESFQHLKHVIRDGWPDRIADVPEIVRPYWTIRDELYEAKDILFKGLKVIIPKALQKEMLALIHETHQGTERCKERARAVMYWPGMSQQIEETVTNCTTCLRYRRSKTREPMIPHPVPQRPWQKLATDVMTYKKKDYAVVIDYYSKYVELYHLMDKTAQSIITGLKSIFARHGIPDELVSDNMPFNSRMFKTFAEEWGFQTTTSSPTYPQSNGLAERNIQTIKQLLRKASYDGKDPYLALLNFRNTPIPDLKASPAQLLFGRSLKTKLPAHEDLLTPKEPIDVEHQLRERQQRQKSYYDRGAVASSEMQPGDVVRVQKNREWEPATVTAVHRSPRSYLINHDGRAIRRNRRQLQPTAEPPPSIDAEWDTTDLPLEEDTRPPSQDPPTNNTSNAEPTNKTNISQDTPEHRITSRGRIVRKPARYRDYV